MQTKKFSNPGRLYIELFDDYLSIAVQVFLFEKGLAYDSDHSQNIKPDIVAQRGKNACIVVANDKIYLSDRPDASYTCIKAERNWRSLETHFENISPTFGRIKLIEISDTHFIMANGSSMYWEDLDKLLAYKESISKGA